MPDLSMNGGASTLAGSFVKLLQQLRGYIPRANQVQFTMSLDSPSLLNLKASAEVIVPGGANNPTRVKATALWAQSIIVMAGPREDGTANAGTIFFGTQGVSMANGFPLAPGASLAIGASDLGQYYFTATDAADRLRIFYLA